MSYAYTDHLPADFTRRSLRADVLAGLLAEPKWLPPKWFYDKNGSALFEEITQLPEYYPTRTERAILQRSAAELVAQAGCTELVELGSGSSEKTRLLLDALPPTGSSYVALDVSETALRMACESVAAAYPRLRVEAVRADFESQLSSVLGAGADSGTGTGTGMGRRLVAFLGGTIGNLTPQPRREFLAELRAGLSAGDSFLLGADLVKPAEVLVPAYDDAAGVTAAFNLNLLEVLNRELGADFDPADFEHRAVWDQRNAWIEMRLRARRAVQVRIAELDVVLDFAEAEELRTEISAKFTRRQLEAEFHSAGFTLTTWRTDPQNLFSLSLWTPSSLNSPNLGGMRTHALGPPA
jgi:L-histidine N-alpha-methyltransferase